MMGEFLRLLVFKLVTTAEYMNQIYFKRIIYELKKKCYGASQMSLVTTELNMLNRYQEKRILMKLIEMKVVWKHYKVA